MPKVLLSIALALTALFGAAGARLATARAGGTGEGEQVTLQQAAQYQWGDQADGNAQQLQAQQELQAQQQLQVREQAQTGSSAGLQLQDCDQQQDQDRLQTRTQARDQQQDRLHQGTRTKLTTGQP